MANKNNKQGVLGIYISPSEIAIADVKLKGGGRLQPDHLVKFSTDFPKIAGANRPMSQNANFFKSTEAWVNKFKTAVKKVNWNCSDAVVTLSEHFAVLRYFSMPAIPRKFWSKSIPLESKKYIPLSFDGTMMNYDAVLADKGKKLSVLFGLSQRDTVNFLTSLLKESGFRLYSLEIASVSLERLYSYVDAKEHAIHGYVHAAEDATHLLFSTGGRPVLHREFENEAGGSERRRFDLKGAIQFVERYSEGEGFKNIILSGDYATMQQETIVKEATPLPVTMFDMAAACGTKDTSSAALFSMGAALLGKVSSKLRMDISGISTAMRVTAEVQKIVYTIGAIVCGFLLLLILNGHRKLNSLNIELEQYTQRNSTSELQGKSVDEVRSKIDATRQQSQVLKYVFNRNEFLAPKLSVLVDAIPKQLWLESITYNNPLTTSKGGGGDRGSARSLVLSGGTYLSGEARAQVTEGFLRELKTYTTEYKSFIPPVGNMSLSVSVASKNRYSGGFNYGGRQAEPVGDPISQFSIDALEEVR